MLKFFLEKTQQILQLRWSHATAGNDEGLIRLFHIKLPHTEVYHYDISWGVLEEAKDLAKRITIPGSGDSKTVCTMILCSVAIEGALNYAYRIAGLLAGYEDKRVQCGRPVGGLGSVQTIYQAAPMTGIGTEWREADSPRDQAIVPDPQVPSLQSDNAIALLNLYQQLGTDDERIRFVSALLRRMSRGTEYASVGYLILLVLFRIGRLPEALTAATQHLQDDGAFGFSDLLRLLDGLLRFEHSAFSSDLLDEIERFLQGTQEHAFGIRERIAAIRAFRLRALPKRETRSKE